MKKFLIGALGLLLSCSLGLPAFAQFNPTPTSAPVYNGLQAATTSIANKSGPATKWTYVGPTGGITTATAVTIKAATSTLKKNYLIGARFYNSGAAGTELVINCGASGTAIWRGWVGATASLAFDPAFALQCPANTLLEVVTVSGTTIAIRVFAQGYTD